MSERLPIFDRFSALADPTRARLLLALERRELAVAELTAVLQLPQSTVSRHLKVLTGGGWLVARREGTSRHYSLAPDRLSGASRRLWQLVREEVAATPTAAADADRLRRVLAERRARSREFFASAAGRWDRLRRDLFGRDAEAPVLLGLLDERWTVGDLGCGTGRAAEALAPYVERVVAIDNSEAMLEEAARRLTPLANVELRRGELESLPVADGELDAALLVLVLHHVADPGEALAEVARALAPGGRLLIVDLAPHERLEFRDEMGHLWLGFSEAQLGGWLSAAGFASWRLAPLAADREAPPAERRPALFALTARRAEGAAVIQLSAPATATTTFRATAEIPDSRGA